jgi:cell division protein FtsI (penicillin-binding protein 3)
MSGVVFHHISEGVMAQNLKLSVEDARNSISVLKPDVKNGDAIAAEYVLNHLGVKANGNWKGISTNGARNIMPDVTGMGARDAVYQLESRGVKAIVKGRGRVKSQSIYSGTAIKHGMACELHLE